VLVAEVRRAARDDLADLADVQQLGRRHLQHGLHAPVIRVHAGAGELCRQPFLAPAAEGALRCPVAGAGVDHRAPAHGAPGKNRDADVAERHRHPLVAVELLVARWAQGECLAPVEISLLEEEHRPATRGQLVRRGRAAGAGADDHHLAFEIQILLDLAAVGDLPEPAWRLVARRLALVSAADVGKHLRPIEVQLLDGGEHGAQQRAQRIDVAVAPVLEHARARLHWQRGEGASVRGHRTHLGHEVGGAQRLRRSRRRLLQPAQHPVGSARPRAVEKTPGRDGRLGHGGDDPLLALGKGGTDVHGFLPE
jgi:hypothetical protein